MTRKLVNPSAPHNLFQLVTAGSQSGFEIRLGYSLQLQHGLMGYFPAIIAETSTPVLTFDDTVIEDVWKLLPPRRSMLSTAMFAVNMPLGVCYLITGEPDTSEMKHRRPQLPFLNRSGFEELVAKDAHPFSWAPGLMGDNALDPELHIWQIQHCMHELRTARSEDEPTP